MKVTDGYPHISQYIPKDLQGMFYRNTVSEYKFRTADGYDPYGFSTKGLVLYHPMWAQKGLTCKSVDAYKHTITRTASGVLHFDGTSNSSVTFGVIHNASAKFWFSMNLRPDTITGTQYLMMKDDGGGETLSVYMDGATLKYKAAGSGDDFDLTVGTLAIGGVYHLFVSLSVDNAVIAILNGGTPVTDTSAEGTPNGGALIVGNSAVDADNAFEGEIWGMSCGVADLSAPEKAALNATGVLPTVYTESWPADEGTGTNINDQQGTDDADGTADTACTWENVPQHQRANGHIFDGFDDKEVVPDHAAFDITTTLTVILWVKVTDITAPSTSLFCKYVTTGGNREWNINKPTGNGKIEIFFGDPSDGSFEGTQTTNDAHLVNATWAMVGFTFNAGTAIIYFNGGVVASTATNVPVSLFNGTGDIQLGAQQSTQYLTGSEGDAWIYNRALSAGEIAHIYNCTRWRYQ